MVEPGGQIETRRNAESLAPIDRGFGTLAKPRSEGGNEDSGRVTPFGLIIADGVGSAYRSDEVSRLAVQAVAEYTTDLPLQVEQNRVEERLHASVARATEDIRDFMTQERQTTKQAGTTLLAAHYSVRPLDKQPQLTVLQIGDCELWALTATDFIRLDRPDNQLWNTDNGISRDDIEQLQELFDERGQQEGMFRDIAQRYFNGRFSPQEVAKLHRKYNTPTQLNNRFSAPYRVDTRPLPPGTLAIVAQTDGIRKGIPPEEEAKIIREARSTQQGVDKILATGNFTGDDATVGVLQLRPSAQDRKRAMPRFAVPAAAATALAAAAVAWGLSGDPTPPPGPAAKVENTRPSSEKRESRPVYGDLDLRSYIEGQAKITIGGPEGATVRDGQPTNTDEIAWPISVDKIRGFNGVRIDTTGGSATFVMDSPPVTAGRDPLKPPSKQNMGGTWIVVEVEVNMAGTNEQPRWVKHDAYINVGPATQGAVEVFDRRGKPMDTSQPLPQGRISKNNEGYRFDESGFPIGIIKPQY